MLKFLPLLALFLFQGAGHPVVFVIDDAHPASAGIQGYRWNVDGVKFSTKVAKPPPCMDCMERTYRLPPGQHSLTITPYTKSGDVVADVVTYDVLVDVTGDATETFVYIGLTEKPKGR
jgi:hypothetical protein